MNRFCTSLLAMLLLLALAARAGDQGEDLQIVKIGNNFATTTPLLEGDEVRIRVRRKGDNIGDTIVLAGFSETQVKYPIGSNRGVPLKTWSKQDIEENQVLTYTLEEPAYVGIGMGGNTYTRSDAVRKGDHFEMTFSSVLHQWVLEVKFVKPEF